MSIFELVLTPSTIMIIVWRILFIVFIIFRWSKSSKKEKTGIILLFLLELLIFIPSISRDNSIHLLNGFKANIIVIEYEDTTVSAPIDEKFINEYENKNEELILAKDEGNVFYYSAPLDSGIDNEEAAEEFTDLNIN